MVQWVQNSSEVAFVIITPHVVDLNRPNGIACPELCFVSWQCQHVHTLGRLGLAKRQSRLYY